MPHGDLKPTARQKPAGQAAYETWGPEVEIWRHMVQARQDAGLTQAQVAERMGTNPPAVTRLEASLRSGKHSPSLATLRKYAESVGCRLEVRLVRARARSNQGMQPTR
jgi:DNA-binding XRE family transcriptional regulator